MVYAPGGLACVAVVLRLGLPARAVPTVSPFTNPTKPAVSGGLFVPTSLTLLSAVTVNGAGKTLNGALTASVGEPPAVAVSLLLVPAELICNLLKPTTPLLPALP